MAQTAPTNSKTVFKQGTFDPRVTGQVSSPPQKQPVTQVEQALPPAPSP